MNIHSIREDPEFYKENQKKRFLDEKCIDTILDADKVWKTYLHKTERLRTLKNKLDKCFRNAPEEQKIHWDEHFYTLENLIDDMANGTKDVNILTKGQLKIVVGYIKEMLASNEKIQNGLLDKRDRMINELGNILNPYVPISKDEKNNVELEIVDNTHLLNNFDGFETMLSHIDLLDKLGFVDTIGGQKVAGNRGYFLTGFGVKLNMALIKYALDFLDSKKYKLMETPHFVTDELMGQIAQLSDYDETLYKLEGQNKFLIATSEQPLTAYFANASLNKKDLPIKMAGVSSCYRKETGAHGRNTRGIYRVHQFTKVEQFCVTTSENSWGIFDQMINTSKEFYNSLGITYRIVNIASGALNNSASMKYDLEAWFPGSNDYCELVSCTNCLDYFSRKIKTKYDKNEFVHMLNCTLCANTRTLCCLVETYQTKDGIIIPPVLRPYLDNIEFVKFVK